MNNKIILDVDSVGDDILAIIFGLLNEETNVIGITTVVGASGSDISHATNVALKSVEVTGKNIPVYSGETNPINFKESEVEGDPVKPFDQFADKYQETFHQFNEPFNDIKLKPEKQNAIDYIIETINENPHEITIVTTGPLTNIAQAIKKDPTIVNKLKEMFVLGGAFKVPANITPVVEYNIYGDPEAANMVLNSDVKITLVPLDVCECQDASGSMLTRDDLEDLKRFGKKSMAVDFIINKFPIYIDMWREKFDLVGFPMDDVITLALVAYPDICEYTDWVHVDVELEGKLTRGQTIAHFGHRIMEFPATDRKNVRIAKSIDGRKFIKLFKDTLS